MIVYALFYKACIEFSDSDELVLGYTLDGVFSTRENAEKYMSIRQTQNISHPLSQVVSYKWVVVEVQLDSYGFSMPGKEVAE